MMERDGLRRVYETYRRPLLLYALALCGDRQDAEDLVQSAFLKAMLSYRSTGSIRHWLVKVLRNEFLNQQKKRARLDPDGAARLEELAAPDPGLLDRLIDDEEKRRLFAAIAELPDMQKAVLLDGVWFGLTDAEIADAHGLTRANIRQLRARAKKRLRELLQEEEPS